MRNIRYEDMTVEGRMAARRLHDKLCELTAEYKGVRVEMCVNCVSRCEYGKELLEAMGMKPEETVRRERLYTDPVLGQGAQIHTADWKEEKGMTVYDVLKKAEPSQRMRITDEVRGSVSGSVFSLHEMLGGVIMSLEVDIIRAEDGVIVVEVKSE